MCNTPDFVLDDKEFVSYRNSCYIFIDKIQLEWSFAQLECQKMNGSNLVSILDPFEYSFLLYYTQQYFDSNQFWIGFYSEIVPKKSSQLLFRWADEWPVYETYWDNKQPLFTTNSACVYQNRDRGKWSVDSCQTKKSFICKSTQNLLPFSQNNSNFYCPHYMTTNPKLSWIDLNMKSKFCYWFSVDVDPIFLKITWAEASLQCRQRGGTLASIHSYDDLMIMRDKFDKSIDNTWIGLYKSNSGMRSIINSIAMQ